MMSVAKMLSSIFLSAAFVVYFQKGNGGEDFPEGLNKDFVVLYGQLVIKDFMMSFIRSSYCP